MSDFQITLVTPTGDRPAQFALCERWVARQSYRGLVQWIVVDDGRIPAVTTRGQQYVRREPRADDPEHTLGRNLLEALGHVRSEKVLVIEDDDWYHPRYVETYAAALDAADLVGGAMALYYNLSARRWKQIGNMTHASLCETGFRATLLPEVREACTAANPFIDTRLWSLAVRRQVISGQRLCVGMKGFPRGRAGLTCGHILDQSYHPDPHLHRLRELIGEDAGAYEALLGDAAGSVGPDGGVPPSP